MRISPDSACLGLAALLAAAPLLGQEAPTPPRRPPEGSVIINLPSADVNENGSLQFLINHRFAETVQGSTLHSFFSFFSPADVGLGLSYVPLRGLEAGFLRTEALEDYEVFAKYAFLASPESLLHAALRVGGDFRAQKNYPDRSSFFGQAIVAVTIASRVRISAVPTYSSRAAGQVFVLSVRKDVFNVPFALSGAITRSINVQGEVVPRTKDSPGVGWIAAIEKTVLRHRFSFTVGNLREKTVDQYVASDFRGLSPHDIYFGFNIVRQWKLK